MTNAYQCDGCNEFDRFEPEFSGETRVVGMGNPKTYDLCGSCWRDVKTVIQNPDPPEDRLDARHHNAPKDANDDPRFPEVED